ncbi:1-acyl-sn-glycerol-3-phosphate acyltransferase [Candidatus Saccharibacteria bacterium]|nr:1-acyl-sn-glycerol-3-phosphate acyltransferase [Candidatus Saccharibacteria bacterium]
MSAESPSWQPDLKYYQRVAESNVMAELHVGARAVVALGRLLRFGRYEIITTPAFDRTDLSGGNIIVSPVHRDGLDTVLLPSALERVGIRHARPAAKLELFQNSIMRWTLDGLGAFPVDRKSPNMEGFDLAHAGILSRGGNVTNYAEGTRVHKDVLRVAKVKSGVARAAVANNSLIVPVGIAGLSSEKDDQGNVIRRDTRSWFGIGPKLVFAFGDPFRLVSKFASAEVGDIEMAGGDLSSSEQKERDRGMVSELRDMNTQIREAMQLALDAAYEARGSGLEEVIIPDAA